MVIEDALDQHRIRQRHNFLTGMDKGLGLLSNETLADFVGRGLERYYQNQDHGYKFLALESKTGLDAWDLLRATFPAGTLSGAPKVRAMEIISELEKAPRGAYGGAVGYVSFSGNLDMAITIRTACIEDDLLTVRAGAGIVADSDPEQERIETHNKAKAIQRALELLQG